MLILGALVCAACAASNEAVQAQASAPDQSTHGASFALTIYNQDFAVVRQVVPLTLVAGVNSIDVTGMTAQVEPDSVLLRDPKGAHPLQILEQNYRNDPVTQERLLDLYKGQTIDFLENLGEGKTRIVRGKIIRSGYTVQKIDPYGNYVYQPPTQPVIEVESTLRFQLPGLPLFPALKDDTVLEPTMHWRLETDRAGSFDAELAYVTRGASWHADYNAVAPEKGETLDFVGWITIDNRTGTVFPDARIKLIAGDVHKLEPPSSDARAGYAMRKMEADMAAPVSEKSFDEYHLYTLHNTTTLHDAETKQVEFVRAADVRATRLYVYDGALLERWYGSGWNMDPNYGTQSNPKVWVMREFDNSAANHLGIALPAGRVRFYRRDEDGQLEFTGENRIDHTPKDEKLRIYTGNAFDVVGERKRTEFQMESDNWFDETFEIRLRNHKQEQVEIRVVEHLFRWTNWQIQSNSTAFEKKDAQTIEFKVTVPVDGEQVITYKVHYFAHASDAKGK